MTEKQKFQKKLDALKRASLDAISAEIAEIEADAKRFSEQYGAEYLPADSLAAKRLAMLRMDYAAISKVELTNAL